MRKQRKNISCRICGRKYSDMDAVRNHIQRNHPESRLSPELEDDPFSKDIPDPAAATTYTNQAINESTEASASQAETGPIVLQLSYSLSGGSPWRIVNDDRWRIFHHPEFPTTGPSCIDAERIQGLPGKTETISNVIIKELDNTVKKTQAIILSPTREAAQTMYTLVSASAAASAVTAHLSVGGTNTHEDRQRLKERPHIVVGTIGRIFAMLERKTIQTSDIKFLCVDGIHQLLGVNHENEFAEFCEQLPKVIDFVLLSTKARYKTSHDLSRLFTHKPLHFLVKEDPAPESSVVLHDPESISITPNQLEDMTRSAVILDRDSTRLTWFRCEVGECTSKFPTKDELRSHTRFFHWQTTSKPGEKAAVAGDNVPYNDEGPGKTGGVMYLCGLCERYPPFKSSWEFGRHLNRMHLGSGNVSVSNVGLATDSASDGPYMTTYLIRQTEGTTGSTDPEPTQDRDCEESGSSDDDDDDDDYGQS